MPAEVPKTWPAEALEAQAVASRSYALANLERSRPFDLYGDTRSQAYAGASGESPQTSAAVAATKGEVVLYRGKVADTLYFSTSGGRTASALDSIGLDAPYLVPVSDPYDTLSPYHDWGPVALDAAKVTKALKLSAPLADLQATPGPSGRVRTVTVSAADESQVTLSGDQVRDALGLRSNWFTAAFLQLLPAAKTMTYGGAVSLTGAAHGVASLSLEARTAAAPGWAPAGNVALGPGGVVHDRRQAPGDHAVPPRLGPRPGRSREDRGRAARERGRRCRRGDGVDQPHDRRRCGAAPAAIRRRLGDRRRDRHRRVRRVELSRGARVRAPTVSVVRRARGSYRAAPRRCSSSDTRRARAGCARRACGAGGRGGFRQPRAARGPPVVSDERPRLDVLADRSAALPDQRRRGRLGDRRNPSRVRRSRRRGEVVRGRLAVSRRPGARDVRRRRDRRQPEQQPRHRRHGLQREADGCQGRQAQRLGAAAGRGRRDSLGGRQRRPGDQSQPRRSARPARSAARHLLAARAGRRRIRLLEGSGRRGGSRQRAAVAGDAVELRALSRRPSRT